MYLYNSKRKIYSTYLAILFCIVCLKYTALNLPYFYQLRQQGPSLHTSRQKYEFNLIYSLKRCVYILAFGAFNSKQVNVSGIQHFLAQLYGLELRKKI